MTNAWVVRAHPDGQDRAQTFLEHDLIAIGWPRLADLTPARDRNDIESALKQGYGYSSGRSVGQATGIVHRFRFGMTEGDHVVVPVGDQVFIGQITSSYRYDPSKSSDEEGYPHQRKVRWFFDKRAIPRRQLVGRMHDALKGRQSVFRIDVTDVEQLLDKPNFFTEPSHANILPEYRERFRTGQIQSLNSSSFEDAIADLYSRHFPGLRRQSTTASEKGDTDLKAELPGGVVVRIQLKHFYADRGPVGPEAVQQLADSMKPGENGIVLTSGEISEAARAAAATWTDRSIGFIDGVEIVDYLFEVLDDLPDATLAKFGLTRRPEIL